MILNSDGPWAIILTLIPKLPIVLKILPHTPLLHFMFLPTIATKAKSSSTITSAPNSFFISDEPVEKFYIGDVELIIGEIGGTY